MVLIPSRQLYPSTHALVYLVIQRLLYPSTIGLAHRVNLILPLAIVPTVSTLYYFIPPIDIGPTESGYFIPSLVVWLTIPI